MSIKFYVNTKYDTYQTRSNGNTIVKISGVLNDGNGPMFAVLNVVDTGKTQVQNFADVSATHLYGLTDTNHYAYEFFVSDVLPHLGNDIRKALYDCTLHLDRSFKNCALKNRLENQTQADAFIELRKFRKEIQPLLRGDGLTPANNKNTVENADTTDCEWHEMVDLINDLPPETLNGLMAKFNSENFKQGDVIIEGDKAYRIMDDGTGAKIYYTRDVEKVNAMQNGKSLTSPLPEKSSRRRNTKQVVFVKDNSHFEGIFECGMFYEIVKSETGYTTIYGADGENHTLNNKRLEFVDVYAAAPEAEVVA